MIAAVSEALEAIGLCLRGGFAPTESDGVPPHGDGRPARAVILAGNAGPAMWKRFAAERPPGADPLDNWCALRLSEIAGRFGARAVFPFQRPYLPFQRWLMRAEPCHASPLGILIHPRHGLWHGLRGALIFGHDLALPPVPAQPSPCETCAGRPCLSTCPVKAFSGKGYDVPRCGAHLRRPEGRDCMALGCRARRACPVGASQRDEPAQAAFHMAAFLETLSAPCDRATAPPAPSPSE